MKESHRSLLLKEKGEIILAGILFAFIHKTQRGKCRDTPTNVYSTRFWS